MRFSSVAALFVLISVIWAQQPMFAQLHSPSQTFYVSKNGSNQDGLSWATAWNELDQIAWEHVQAGALIYIDGGENEMRYESELLIGSSGTENAPIQIMVSTEAGHQGQVIFFGGRTEALPYCGQSDYVNLPDEQMREYGIRSNDHDYVVIDGGRWRGIIIHGYRGSGMRIDAGSQHITAQYMEIYNNGEAVQNDEGWRPNHPGIRLGGEHIRFRRLLIHDNGQDAIQSLSGENRIHNFHLEQSWLYNERRHPSVNESSNFCTHSDGLQIFDGGIISGIRITDSIIGPGFTQNVLLGQSLNENGSWADVHDVTFQDVVFTKAADNNVVGYRDTDSSNWTLNHVTIDCLETKSHCLRIPNSNHAVRHSIVINGLITFPDGLDSYIGNCVWNTEGFDLGVEQDPLFINVSLESVFSLDDYTVRPESSCAGSRMRSAAQLLELN